MSLYLQPLLPTLYILGSFAYLYSFKHVHDFTSLQLQIIFAERVPRSLYAPISRSHVWITRLEAGTTGTPFFYGAQPKVGECSAIFYQGVAIDH